MNVKTSTRPAQSKVLVTGGCGFIGTNLVRELRLRGHEVWTCDIVQSEDAQHIRADVSVFRQVQCAINSHEFDYIFHLAAEYGRWNGEASYENVWQTNVIGTKNILSAVKGKSHRIVFFSSAEVYGDYDGVMTEDVMDNVAIRQMNDYAISKWAGELQCVNHAAMYGNEIVRVRPVGCYGPHEKYSPFRGVIPIFVHSAMNNLPLTVHTGHYRIFDYVEDTCATLANIIDNFVPGEVYNVGGRQEWATTIERLAEIVIEEVGAAPALICRIGQEAFTTRTKIVDSSKASRDLAHDPRIDLREGVRRYVGWFGQRYGALGG